jgi:hypothetical protein
MRVTSADALNVAALVLSQRSTSSIERNPTADSTLLFAGCAALLEAAAAAKVGFMAEAQVRATDQNG